MDLVDEEDYLSGAVNHFFDNAFQPFLEFSLIFRSRDEGAHVEGIDFFALKVLWDVAVNDLLGDALGNRGLADSGFSHEYRVVFGPPAQDLEDSSYFVVPADDRVEFALRSLLIEVDGELRKELQLIVIVSVVHILCLLFKKNVRPSGQTLKGQNMFQQRGTDSLSVRVSNRLFGRDFCGGSLGGRGTLLDRS